MNEFVGYVPVDDESEEDNGDASRPSIGSEPPSIKPGNVNGLPEIYYDSVLTNFLVGDASGRYMRIKAPDVRLRLVKKGYHAKPQGEEKLSQVNTTIIDIQDHQNLSYFGSLAGFMAGAYLINGARILVKDSPCLMEPQPGEWVLIESVIYNMLGPQQAEYLFGWIKTAIESLRSHNLRPGQALCLAGPKDCGKSLLQILITLLLGGRSQKAHRYASGGTPFNSELFGAEHLIFEDEEASTEIRTRRNFGAKLKEIAANLQHSCHAKHREALALPPFWRASISVNDEPEHLMILPPMDQSLEDKLIILKAVKDDMPMPTAEPDERVTFMAALRKELAHFMDFLLNWQIPEGLVSQRYGIKHFHHPEIMETLGDLAPENRLREIIDHELFEAATPELRVPWLGTATELERKLTGPGSGVCREASKLFTHGNACANYLGRLANLDSDRFKLKRSAACNRWEISPPARKEEEA